MNNSHKERISLARKVMCHEANSISETAKYLNESFSDAVDILRKTNSKVIVTGIGKSGHLGKRIAATLSSTGTPSAYLHPSEAVHGDLGIHQSGDPIIFLSNSGTTPELLFLEPILRERKSKIIGILGKSPSPLSRVVDVVIEANVASEADPLGIVPTSSCAVASSLADALASVLMHEKKFTKTDYMKTHPAGQLGKNLLFKVCDVMIPKNEVAILSETSCMKNTMIKMTEFPLGVACIERNSKLIGIITDGDLRRSFTKFKSLDDINAGQVMTENFEYISPKARLGDALEKMEKRDSPISVLPVVENANNLLGIVRIHDIYSPATNT